MSSNIAADKQKMRQNAFKKAVDADDARRKREENTIQIRKSKKEERLQKRRMAGSRAAMAGATSVAGGTAAADPGVAQKVRPSRLSLCPLRRSSPPRD